MVEGAVVASEKMRKLKALFEPKTVAVIGASRRKETVGYAVQRNLLSAGFKGKIYLINPKATEIEGIRCYPSLLDVPEAVDLAVVIVPSVSVPETLEICGKKGIPAAIVISAGFREIGEEGRKLEEKVAQIVKRFSMSILGPNCLGLINTDPTSSMNASFSRTMPRPGNIAFVSQSGALCAAILDYAKGENIGFSKFISLGNKVDLNEVDVLQYLRDDPTTDVILMYLEDLVGGQSFIQIAREITGDLTRPKPILAIKAGRTPQGAKAASSHTGSLMGADEVYDAIFTQAGVLRVDSVEEIFDLALAFAYQPIPKSNRIAIVTNAGGPGIMATDSCVRYGLEMAKLDPATVESLRAVLPPTANLSNPVDVIGDAQHDRYEHALTRVISDPNVDNIIVLLTPQAMTDIEDIAKAVVRVSQTTKKTLLACFMGSFDVLPGVKIFEENNVPHYKFPEEAARALGAMVRFKEWIDRPRTDIKVFSVDSRSARSVIKEARSNHQRLLTTHQAMKVLGAYGFPLLPFQLAKSSAEASAQAKEIGFPVAMKIVSPDIIHKLDVGGVRIHLNDAGEVERAFNEITAAITKHSPQAKVDGILVQAMGRRGHEVILGMKRDPHFGPILMFGLGGTYVEVLKDVAFRLAPIRELSAKGLIESIRTYPILKGIRGEPPADLAAIIDCLERLSQLACNESEIVEIDINPLVAYEEGQGVRVVDARMVLKS